MGNFGRSSHPKKKGTRYFAISVGICLLLFLWKSFANHNSLFLAVIPHFMIQPNKVERFYAFLKQQYFPTNNNPDQIIILSPNHFFPKQTKVEGLCLPTTIRFKNQILSTQAFTDKRIDCHGKVFYSKGDQTYVKDHGLGEHFYRINQFFPKVRKIYLLALPSHHMEHVQWISDLISQLHGETFVIGSVDFSHYLSESIAEQHDQETLAILQKENNSKAIQNLDVDCPACLGVLYNLAEKQRLSVHQRARDSSSTIVGKDLKEENTSRQFLRRTPRQK